MVLYIKSYKVEKLEKLLPFKLAEVRVLDVMEHNSRKSSLPVYLLTSSKQMSIFSALVSHVQVHCMFYS